MASDRSPAVEPPRWSGRVVVFALLGFGLLLAGGARIWRGGVERRPLDFWGDSAVRLIHSAAEGDVWVFAPSADAAKPAATPATPPEPAEDLDSAAPVDLPVDGTKLSIEKRRRLTPDSSFVHLRRILLSDYCYQWNSPPSGEPRWSMGLRMQGPKGTLVVLFDFKNRLVRDLAGSRSVVMSPLAMQPFEALLQGPQTPAAASTAGTPAAAPTP